MMNKISLYDDNLEEILNTLSEKELHRVISNNCLDSARLTIKWNKEKMIAFIIKRANDRKTKGDVFRNY